MTWPLAVLILGLALLLVGVPLLFRGPRRVALAILAGLLYGLRIVVLAVAWLIQQVIGYAPGILLGGAGLLVVLAGWLAAALWWLLGIAVIVAAGLLFCFTAMVVTAFSGNWGALLFFATPFWLPVVLVLAWRFLRWLVVFPILRPKTALALGLLMWGAWIAGSWVWRTVVNAGFNQAVAGYGDAVVVKKTADVKLATAEKLGQANAADHKTLLEQPNILMQTAKVGEPTGFWGDNNAPLPWKGSPVIPASTPVAHLPEVEGRWIGRDWMVKVCLPGPLGDFGDCPEGWIADRRLDYQKPVPDVRPAPQPTPVLAARVQTGEIAVPPEAEAYVALVDKHLASHPTVPRNLVLAAIQVESKWDPRARNEESGALGLMQLLPDTAKLLGVTDSFDPDQNIGGGNRYLAEQLANFSSTELALAAYHWGPENIRSHPGKTWEQILTSSDEPRPGPRTIGYVRDVIALARGAARQPAVQLASARTFPLRVANCGDRIRMFRNQGATAELTIPAATGWNLRASRGDTLVFRPVTGDQDVKTVTDASPDHNGELIVRVACYS